MSTTGNPTVEQKPKQTSKPTIRPSDVAADRDAVMTLFGRNLPESTTERYDWLYVGGKTRNWVACDEDRQLVGSIGLMPRTMNLFGEEHPCGQPVDLNVDRRYRLGWLALQLQRTIATEVNEGRLSLAYGLPNAQSEAVARRAGYDVVGPVTRWAKPLKTHDYLCERLPDRVPTSAASKALDAALWLRSPESRYRRRRNYRVEVTDTFDERFDLLWHGAAQQFSIIGRRTADYLNWRFCDAPNTVFRTLCLSDRRNDRLLAYLVYTVRDEVAYVADFLHADDSLGDAVMAEFVKMMRVQGAKAIITIFTGAGSVARRLKRFGFSRRPSSWKIMIHSDAVRLGIPGYKLRDVNNWFLTRADVDTEF